MILPFDAGLKQTQFIKYLSLYYIYFSRLYDTFHAIVLSFIIAILRVLPKPNLEVFLP